MWQRDTRGESNWGFKWSREIRRGFYTFSKQHQNYVRRRAILSVMSYQDFGDRVKEEKAVNEVWESCLKDTRPFDEASLHGSPLSQCAYKDTALTVLSGIDTRFTRSAAINRAVIVLPSGSSTMLCGAESLWDHKLFDDVKGSGPPICRSFIAKMGNLVLEILRAMQWFLIRY
ncbi:Mitochondrial inner membrane protease atp23 [Tulasnella sp. JGI-2019a]|nr:Mitochondrial inner membrane protease atp23 [Tulasnella sp. JGI-2019a]